VGGFTKKQKLDVIQEENT